ncbi:MAG: hypothetical protein ABIH76_06565 [Candidatus Bathyarchaeota archaeon]
MSSEPQQKPKLPPEYIPRVEKFLNKIKNNELPETKFIEFLESLIRPVLDESFEDSELKDLVEKQISPLIGRKIWIKAKNQNPVIIEITSPPDLIRFTTSTEENVKNLNLPGVSYDIALINDAIQNKLNPLMALTSGKINVTGLPELIKMGSPLMTAMKPFKDRKNLEENLSRNVLSTLDRTLTETGC